MRKIANIREVRLMVGDGEIHIKDFDELQIKDNKVKIKFRGYKFEYDIDKVYVDVGELQILGMEVSEE